MKISNSNKDQLEESSPKSFESASVSPSQILTTSTYPPSFSSSLRLPLSPPSPPTPCRLLTPYDYFPFCDAPQEETGDDSPSLEEILAEFS